MFPKRLIEIRHAESEGNKAGDSAKQGDMSYYSIPGFQKRWGHNWRLTDLGLSQAEAAGEWLRKELEKEDSPRFYLSPYIRTKETYLGMNLGKEYEVYEDLNLRERSWGDLDHLTPQEKADRFSEVMRNKWEDPMFWTPPNGESLAGVCTRRSIFHGTLQRFGDKYPGRVAVCVSHGENMWAGRHLLVRSTVEQYNLLDRSRDPEDRCHNCQIWEYTRVDPFTGYAGPYFTWFRSICPWDTGRSTNEWQQIVRNPLSTEDLRRQVEAVPRLVS